MNQNLANDQFMKVKHVNYENKRSTKLSKSASQGRNPIKIVVDMIGEDGAVHQKVINQDRDTFSSAVKLKQFRVSRSPRRKQQPPEMISKQRVSQEKPALGRSVVFNKFSYDNYKQLPIPKTLKSKSNSSSRANSGHKNIEIVFCQSKYPDFIQKTNEKIEDLYKQEQIRDQVYYKSVLKNSINFQKTVNPSPTRKGLKTNLANCLKEYATLQKLSLFMENDQMRRQKCLCYALEKDPSRNLLLEIITHRFNFLKKMSRGCRERLYRCLLGRQVSSFTKINIQQYMKISEMFVGRDASPMQVATFMYLFLFGQQKPTIQLAQERLEMLSGQIYKMKGILEELGAALQSQSSAYLLDDLAKRERLLRLFIDFIIDSK